MISQEDFEKKVSKIHKELRELADNCEAIDASKEYKLQMYDALISAKMSLTYIICKRKKAV